MSFYDNFTPQAAFYSGFAVGVLILCSIGFFVLLGLTGLPTSPADLTGVAAAPTEETDQANAPTTNTNNGGIKLAAITTDDHVRGDFNAPVTVVEFSDTECPYCKRFHSTMQQIVEASDGEVRSVYKHFPLDALHSKARKEAEATECAAELGGNDGFWAYLDRLFEITPSNNRLDSEELPAIAEEIGLNRQQFEDCLDSGRYADIVAEDLDQAQEAGGRGTPYSVIVYEDQTIPLSGALPFEQVQAAIDSLIQ